MRIGVTGNQNFDDYGVVLRSILVHLEKGEHVFVLLGPKNINAFAEEVLNKTDAGLASRGIYVSHTYGSLDAIFDRLLFFGSGSNAVLRRAKNNSIQVYEYR